MKETIEAFRRDGAAVLRDVLPLAWIERMRSAVDRILAKPGPLGMEYTDAGKSGRFYGDFFLWLREPEIRAFVFDSPLPVIAAEMMGAKSVRFFYDQLLVKEPGTAERTPWHHDLPYWPLKGTQILSIWVPFDKVTPESGAVTYVAGSHLWGKMFRPSGFRETTTYAKVYEASGFEPMPDISAEAAKHRLLSWSLEPGDVLLHHPLTVHGAGGNSTSDTRRRALAMRYTGDDVTWDPRPGNFMENPALRAHIPDPGLPAGAPLAEPLFPEIWSATR